MHYARSARKYNIHYFWAYFLGCFLKIFSWGNLHFLLLFTGMQRKLNFLNKRAKRGSLEKENKENIIEKFPHDHPRYFSYGTEVIRTLINCFLLPYFLNGPDMSSLNSKLKRCYLLAWSIKSKFDCYYPNHSISLI